MLEIECPQELLASVSAALEATRLAEGHVCVQLVDSETIRELNRVHRGADEPTDVLAFPVDGTDLSRGPRELGDVVICAEHCRDLEEAAVHGVLHLAGYDHESDDGEMLRLQEEVLAGLSDAR